MNELPPELAALATLLEAQPAPLQTAFHYCLCLMMVEAGKMDLVETLPGDSSALCVFQSTTGETFSVARPPMSPEEEASLVVMLRAILKDEKLL